MENLQVLVGGRNLFAHVFVRPVSPLQNKSLFNLILLGRDEKNNLQNIYIHLLCLDMRCVSLTDLPHMSRSYHLTLFYFQSTTVASFEIQSVQVYKQNQAMIVDLQIRCDNLPIQLHIVYARLKTILYYQYRIFPALLPHFRRVIAGVVCQKSLWSMPISNNKLP